MIISLSIQLFIAIFIYLKIRKTELVICRKDKLIKDLKKEKYRLIRKLKKYGIFDNDNNNTTEIPLSYFENDKFIFNITKLLEYLNNSKKIINTGYIKYINNHEKIDTDLSLPKEISDILQNIITELLDILEIK